MKKEKNGKYESSKRKYNHTSIKRVGLLNLLQFGDEFSKTSCVTWFVDKICQTRPLLCGTS